MDETGIAIELSAEVSSRVSLADLQNSVPLLHALHVHNRTDRPLERLVVELVAEPPFLQPKRWRVERVPPGETYALRDRDLHVDLGRLARLTEAECVQLTWTAREESGPPPLTGAIREAAPALLLSDGPAFVPPEPPCLETGNDEAPDSPRTEADGVRGRLHLQMEFLPRRQWGGLSRMPELVAAFVTPNDPAVDPLLAQAADLLKQQGRPGALAGYQGQPKDVWLTASALWSAVAGWRLAYALPPAGFERDGQKVRSPSQIAAGRLATCLDTSLLFCAALEQAGLNPLLIFGEGHAFAGVWLCDEEFSTPVTDDAAALRKRIQLGELLVFETMLVTRQPAPRFTHAVDAGKRHLDEGAEAPFLLAVDIRRCRRHRIKPLAAGESPATPDATAPEPGASAAERLDLDIPALPDRDEGGTGVPTSEGSAGTADRLERWRNRLLDTSLRNNLINFKSGRKSFRLDAPEPALLEDRLAEGKPLRLLPKPALMDGGDPRDAAVHEERTHEDLRRRHALDALARREVFIDLPDEELDARLVELYRAARLALQEGGANTLYLAVGFLAWSRKNEDRSLKAPLVLIPVALHRKTARTGFSLVRSEEEAIFNPPLLEMLRADFRVELPFAGDLPRDDSGLDIPLIERTVAAAVKDIRGWDVLREVHLGSFSFAKHLMWKDLTDGAALIAGNATVGALLGRDTPLASRGISFPEPSALDREFPPDRVFCPLPADSSQLSAVLAAECGKDFVLIGPPGTGKSQTIAGLPTALGKLAPCLLMSPLSVAQYLPVDRPLVDVVVFDEASQIAPWDAVGAMARGRQVVMVGDPKQLPPTTFFNRTDTNADDEDVAEDLESVLDECLDAGLPTRRLSWHYRSRHESLIAFSNHRYYDGGLVTFPSPVTRDRAVRFHFVPGRYEMGGARVNKPEARALVDDLVALLRSDGFAASGRTAGVVTFNQAQQALIENLLDDARRADPSLERYFDDNALEPVFVKNLESVQGDERDVMYFSITYGPDEAGKISMNFGPMNKDGGERRLNVAVTRARRELRVFSGLRADDINLNRTGARGVRDLKHFLDYAERGASALAEADDGSRGPAESPFEEAVAAALRRRGWEVATQIGVSSFRVDLGVVHPDKPGRFLAGVECDGAAYHRSATARDRDKIRESVLRGLGWTVLRVWSTDWWHNERETIQRLDESLKALRQSGAPLRDS